MTSASMKCNYVTAGVFLGVGIVNCCIKNDFDPASALTFEMHL